MHAEFLFILCITFFSIFHLPDVILDFQSVQQCGSWSDGFVRSKLICIHSVFNKRINLGSAGWGLIHYNGIKLGRMRAAVWTARLALFAIRNFISKSNVTWIVIMYKKIYKTSLQQQQQQQISSLMIHWMQIWILNSSQLIWIHIFHFEIVVLFYWIWYDNLIW